MKAERKQELRTNELSQQLDNISLYVRQNATAFISAVVVAVVLVLGVYWYIRSSRIRLMDNWAAVSIDDANTDPKARVARCQEIIDQNLDPKLTAAAWMKMGETSLDQIMGGAQTPGAPAEKIDTRFWLETAERAYGQAIASPGMTPFATAQATISLGIIAENQGNLDKAREHYRKVQSDPRFEGTPFKSQADYRLAKIEEWSDTIVFAPPPPKPAPTSAPAGSMPGSASPLSFSPGAPISITPGQPTPITLTPSPPASASPPTSPIQSTPPAAVPITTPAQTTPPATPAPPPVPTTQPAGND